MQSQSNIFLGRQPIPDRAGRVVAYELPFRAAAEPSSIWVRMVQPLKLRPVRLLAEKLELRERAHRCLAIRIKLFQGYFYGRPAVLAALQDG